MLSLFLSNIIILRILILTGFVVLILRIFKIKLNVKKIRYAEFLIAGLGYILNRDIGNAIKSFFIIMIFDYFIFNSCLEYYKEYFAEQQYRSIFILTLIAFVFPIIFIYKSKEDIYSKNPKKKQKKKSSYSGSYSYDDDDSSRIRDHMEFHHHDSNMP